MNAQQNGVAGHRQPTTPTLEEHNKNTSFSINGQPSATTVFRDSVPFVAEEMERSGQPTKASENVGLFTIRTGNEWIDQAKTRPTPKMLYDVFWFEGEICILFAGSNQGKSILAVQVADSISRGVPIKGFRLEAERQRVLYFDFELSDKQFETRYSADYTGHYSFDEYFLRVEMNSDADAPANSTAFDKLIIESIEQAVLLHCVKVLIILDTITSSW